jgi:hypothetical protein
MTNHMFAKDVSFYAANYAFVCCLSGTNRYQTYLVKQMKRQGELLLRAEDLIDVLYVFTGIRSLIDFGIESDHIAKLFTRLYQQV